MNAMSLQQRFSKKPSNDLPASQPHRSERWAVILAGGDGTRLQSMTRTITGDDRPKQFVPVIGGSTLLDQTRSRVALSVSPARTLIVVTEKHRRFYQSLIRGVSQNFLLEQPANKGTAPAIVYALLRVAAKSPKAIVALFPSDHYFADDEEFMAHVDVAFDTAQVQPQTVTLLGITPSDPETEYGWIEPQRSIFASLHRSVTRVSRFWEKPDANVARSLMNQGCLWNSFVMVGRVDALLKMTGTALPELVSRFTSIMPTFETRAERKALHDLYSEIQDSNFSHQVLAARPEDLTVMRVGDVGWSDLGEPARVLATMAQMGMRTEMATHAG
jgi:mannose-1-phosphate guanylyltransferase